MKKKINQSVPISQLIQALVITNLLVSIPVDGIFKFKGKKYEEDNNQCRLVPIFQSSVGSSKVSFFGKGFRSYFLILVCLLL